MVSFSHRDPGTAEEIWTAAFPERELPRLPENFDHLVVVAAHPDDETLGAAGLMSRTAGRGAAVTVIIATDGEGSHPESPTHTPADLAAIRRDEATRAVRSLSPTIGCRFLGIPDGGTDDHRDEIATAIRGALRGALSDALESTDRVLVVSPWIGDGHRDHRVVGEVVIEVCAELDVPSRGYPIWLWHWGSPGDVPWDRVELVDVDDETAAAKRNAMRLHRSQAEALSSAPGDEVMLHDGMQRHFDRPVEVFVRPAAASLTRDFFDAFYRRNADDPWGFDSRWYEQRKRALTIASLPRPRYRAALELGCATGALTALLADRCDDVLALDIADAPLAAARRRLGERANVRLARAALPREWPDGVFDLIVLSEVGYYWGAGDLAEAVQRMASSLTSDGNLVACHWRHPVAEYPLSGDEVHAALRAEPTLARLVVHEEEDVVIEVFGRPGSRSVAAETGLIP
ncbi:bifunctional PIG-L family deacetylase/class I SAM-dependent methyltransferase [Microbacterium radiodurans]|uniref:Bifunctional PIG-L family deacetylase/class I SAM-dependent methyltransferase n=1 Tax=Microbacterium radiodurans TaxID=661398 RepID=A0A5J5IP88_9MICO|nr:bifunctional PIG-L family deacetylase/class I SAM-dependent methyltransferase [Microbacterium radiodurans]KAA9083772.1 bifunctional PIG-L family deacetylase/class I SAM-dependent methyltransferase [Microbacterium radiodurans]